MKNPIIDALRKCFRVGREEKLDAEFAKMRDDLQYQDHAVAVSSEFEASDWETLRPIH